MMQMSYYRESMHIYCVTGQMGIKDTDGMTVAHQLKRLPWIILSSGLTVIPGVLKTSGGKQKGSLSQREI